MPDKNTHLEPEGIDLDNRLLRAILKHAPVLISAKDRQGNILFTSESFSVLDGPAPHEYVNRNVFDLFPKDIAEQLWANDLKAQMSATPIIAQEEVFHADGTKHIYHTCKFRLEDDNGRLIGTCSVSFDITHMKKMEHQANHDALTDLYNRRYLDECFTSERRRARRDKKHLIFVLFDLDKFKTFNDKFGHVMGDELLIDFAKQLKQHFQRPSDFCFRLGGDEFAVILTTDNVDASLGQITQVTQSVNQHWQQQYEFACSISAGVCIASKLSSSKKAYREADQALYKAKEQGRNRVEVYKQ